MLTLNRPALILSDEQRLSQEFASARWTYHRLLDFEDQHQRVLDAAAEEIAPGIVRIGRILARLARRARRAERTTSGRWSPSLRPELAARLRPMLEELRKIRNADPRWEKALGWADEQIGEPKAVRRRRAKPPEKVKQRKTETDEAFAKRFALLTNDETEEHYATKLASAPRDTRRDQYRKALYNERRIYWGTWNALVASVDQARSDVLKQRKNGVPAQIRRPKFRDPTTLAASVGGFRVVDRPARKKLGMSPEELRRLPKEERKRIHQAHASSQFWTIQMRIGTSDEYVTFRAKCNNWHDVKDAKITTAELTRRIDGERWNYSVSLTVEIDKDADRHATSRMVAFDWGHREHGHPLERKGIRAFSWVGDDGHSGEVLIPKECRDALDEIDAMKARMDEAFNARKAARNLPDRNRHLYRRRLMQSGVRTEEESLWLRWEVRYERRIAKRRKRVTNLRRETYLLAVRELRARYQVFAFEDEAVSQIKTMQKDEQMARRKRSNRDLATRYEFVDICERFGAEIITVPARNSTRECPSCGSLLNENGPELIVVCPGCGGARDKDFGARQVILKRAKEALANRAA